MSEYVGWERHFETHPPDDPSLTQFLLARIVLEMLNISRALGGKPAEKSIGDVAPWLVSPEAKTEMDKKELERRLEITRRMMMEKN